MKRRTLALILAAALTVTSVEGTAVMASAAEVHIRGCGRNRGRIGDCAGR